MKSDRRRPHTRDAGFTLIELLIGIVITGLIMPVITSVFVVIVRNNPTVQTRADDSRSTRGLTTWLPQDVLSTPPKVVTDGSPGYNVEFNKASDCGGTSGTNVLHMVWQENAGSGVVNYVANYRYVTSGGTTQLKRYSCSGDAGAPLPYSNTATRNATTNVKGTSVSATPIFDGSGTRLAFVDVTLQTVSGLDVLIRAASRNPAKVLG